MPLTGARLEAEPVELAAVDVAEVDDELPPPEEPQPAADAPSSPVRTVMTKTLAVGCFTCHGRSGQGGSYNGPAPALAETKLPLEAFKVFVRLGPNDMPAYTESVLSDKDTTDILAFLRSLPGRRPAKDIPLLNP